MRKIYTVASPRTTVSPTNPTTNYDRPKYNNPPFSKIISGEITGNDYIQLITKTATVSRNFTPLYNWSSSTRSDSDFQRDTYNPQFVKGRYLAEVFNISGSGTSYTQISPLPTPEDSTCPDPVNYTLDSNTNTCIYRLPDGSSWKDTNKTSYWNQCPAGYRVDPNDETKCKQSGCAVGTLQNDSFCRQPCPPGSVDAGWDTMMCVSDCVSQIDPKEHPYMIDPTDTRRCVTSPKNTPGMTYSRVVFWFGGPIYAWVRDQFPMNFLFFRGPLRDYYNERPNWAPSDIQYDLKEFLRESLRLMNNFFDNGNGNVSEFSTGEARYLNYTNRTNIRRPADVPLASIARPYTDGITYSMTPL